MFCSILVTAKDLRLLLHSVYNKQYRPVQIIALIFNAKMSMDFLWIKGVKFLKSLKKRTMKKNLVCMAIVAVMIGCI